MLYINCFKINLRYSVKFFLLITFFCVFLQPISREQMLSSKSKDTKILLLFTIFAKVATKF